MSAVNIIKILILIIKIGTPIILIVVLALDFTGAIKTGNEDLLKKAEIGAVKKIIAATLIFLIPSFVKLIVQLSNPDNEYLYCLNNATEEKAQESFTANVEALVSKAEATADYGDYSKATLELSNIKDKEIWQSYTDRLDSVFMVIQSKIEVANEDYNVEGSGGSNIYEGGTGNTTGNGSRQGMIDVAASQIGNENGEKFWRWWGYSGRVAWCAIFVSWVSEQNGLIASGIIPKFQGCYAGATWFQEKGQWKDNSYTPSPGDIIFFNWADSNAAYDHVGIVEYVSGDEVHTIEGNASNQVKRCTRYKSSIAGYGVPNY